MFSPLVVLFIIIIIIINLFRQVFNVSVCTAQRQVFVIASVFDVCFLRINEPSTHEAFTFFKSTTEARCKIKVSKEGVKSIQS